MLDTQISAQFKRLGLSDLEARVYLSLLNTESSSGYQLSKKSNVPSSKIYQILNNLLHKGLIVATDTHPAKYVACPPEDVIRRLSSDFSSCIGELSRNLKLYKSKSLIPEQLALNVVGRKEIIQRSRESILKSERSIFIAAWNHELKLLRSQLAAAESRRVKIKIVSYGRATIESGVVYAHRPTDYPYREREERRFSLVVDSKISVIANIGRNSETGLYTRNPGLVHLIRDFIIHEIYIILIEKAYPEEVSRVVGKSWEKARFHDDPV